VLGAHDRVAVCGKLGSLGGHDHDNRPGWGGPIALGVLQSIILFLDFTFSCSPQTGALSRGTSFLDGFDRAYS